MEFPPVAGDVTQMLAVEISLLIERDPVRVLASDERNQPSIGFDLPDDVAPFVREIDSALTINDDARARIGLRRGGEERELRDQRDQREDNDEQSAFQF